jgi:HSP20 family protein
MSGRASRPARGQGTGPGGPWDPIADLMSLKDRMNRLLESVLVRGEFPKVDAAGWSPAVDLREDREAYVLAAELPGVRREDIRIRIEGGLLTLEGERPPDQEGRSADHLRIERSYGPFLRRLPLPGAVDEEKVTARFDHGVLEVFLPKSTGARAHPLSVRVN